MLFAMQNLLKIYFLSFYLLSEKGWFHNRILFFMVMNTVSGSLYTIHLIYMYKYLSIHIYIDRVLSPLFLKKIYSFIGAARAEIYIIQL